MPTAARSTTTDHTDRSSKSFTIATYIRAGWDIPSLLQEIAKCDVVCANCHADRTYKGQHWLSADDEIRLAKPETLW